MTFLASALYCDIWLLRFFMLYYILKCAFFSNVVLAFVHDLSNLYLGTLMTICASGFKMSSWTDLPTLHQDHTLIASTSSCNLGLRFQSFFMLYSYFLTVSTSLRFLFTLSYPLVWPQLCYCLWLQPWCGASGEFRCFSPLWEHSQPSPWWPWPLARTTGCMLGPLSATALPTPLRMTHTTRTRRILELSPTPASGGFAAWKVSEQLRNNYYYYQFWKEC